MNEKQKTVIIIFSILIALLLLFPPWASITLETGVISHYGYHFIASPPSGAIYSSIYITRLLLPILAVIVFGTGLYLVNQDKKK